MPIFEYECKKCGKEFEVLVFSRDEKIECEFCGSKSVKKLMSAVGMKSGEKFTSSSSTPSCHSCSSSSCSTCK